MVLQYFFGVHCCYLELEPATTNQARLRDWRSEVSFITLKLELCRNLIAGSCRALLTLVASTPFLVGKALENGLKVEMTTCRTAFFEWLIKKCKERHASYNAKQKRQPVCAAGYEENC